MYVFPVPADPAIKKNEYFPRFIGPRLAVIMFMMLYCSSGRLIIIVCGNIRGHCFSAFSCFVSISAISGVMTAARRSVVRERFEILDEYLSIFLCMKINYRVILLQICRGL